MATTKKKNPKLAKRSLRNRDIDAGRAAQLASVIAAVVIAILINVLSARHYKRVDVTHDKLYTLTDPTLQTLHSLSDTVQVWVILGGGDPMEQSVKHLLASYTAETSKLDVHYIDPDRDVLDLADLRKRFRLETGRSEGRDAIVVVAHGERHWFLTVSDMVEIVSEGEDTKAKPREEQAVTAAIRNVLSGDRTKLCFVTGHGERSLEDGSDEGLGLLREILDKDNFEPVTVDTTPENAHEPFTGCAAVVIAGPSERIGPLAPMSEAEANRLRTYLLNGGSLLLAIGPNSDVAAAAFSPILDPFGISLGNRLAIEVDPQVTAPDERGTAFTATAKPHAITQSLVANEERPGALHHIVIKNSRALEHSSSPGAAVPVDLAISSPASFAVSAERAGAIVRTPPEEIPEKQSEDLPGPLVLAMASERPKVSSDARHGPRVVVIGMNYVFSASNWRVPAPYRGGAELVENAIAWLALKPAILDVPSRPSVSAGLHVTEEVRGKVRNYVVFFMPLAGLLLGLAVFFRRRSTEGLVRAKKSAPGVDKSKRVSAREPDDDAS